MSPLELTVVCVQRKVNEGRDGGLLEKDTIFGCKLIARLDGALVMVRW